MTAIPHAVSDRILRPLREVAARQWKVVAARGALQTLVVAMAVLLPIALLLGLLGGMPSPLRIALAALAWASVLAAAIHFLRPALRRRSINDAAFTVERRTPGLDERLSSTVELSAEQSPFAGSPALLRHLARQAEADAAAVRPHQVVPADAVRRWAILLAPLLILWLALTILLPRPMLGGLYRALMPWRADLPALLTRIAVTPGDVTLAEGDALEIRATLNDGSMTEKQSPAALLLTKPLYATGNDRPLARDLQRLAPREFRATLDDLRQSLRYQVSTDRGESPWYTATVLPRPAVVSLDVRYEYPPYTGMDARNVLNSDGTLRALQGTDVTLTLHVSQPLDLAGGKSRIGITEGSRQRTIDLKPVEGQPNVYEAKLTVFSSGSYRFQLVNDHGLANKEEQPRTITAEFDQPPKIAITAPQSQVTVRADDDVPVLFKSSDDFGVAKVQAVVQVDDKAPQEFDVPPGPSTDRRQLDGQYLLSVAYHLGRAGVEDAGTITYWLKATDNRDPDPQTVESARQTLKIDRNQSLSYRARAEQEQAKDLVRAIDKAIQRLQESEGQVNALKAIEPNRAMRPDEKQRADEQRDRLATTSKDLGEAAESNLRTAFNEIAQKAQSIAQGPIQDAAENVARSRLNAEQAEPRKQAAEQAARQVVDARKQLEELKKQVEAQSAQVQSARELEKLAEKQTQLAAQQAKAGPRPKRDAKDNPREQWQQAQQKFQQRQRELLDRLNHTIGQDETLRDPKAVEQAVRLRELLDRVQQIQKDQSPLQEQVAKQQQVAELQEKAETLAEQQQKLNEQIEAFSEKQHAPLQQAETRAPDRQHQAGIVDRLRRGEAEEARGMQKQSADQLIDAARRLEKQGHSNELKPDAVQQNALNLREQARQAAKQAEEQAKQAGMQLQKAKLANDAGQLAEAQKKAEQAAQDVKKLAEDAEAAAAKAAQSDDPTAKKNAEEAKRAADAAEAASDAARQAAAQANADQAAQKLNDAAERLATARHKAVDAIKADFLDDQRDAAKAAGEQAKELAERQKQLAEAAKTSAEALARARRDQQSPQDVANRQNQLKDQTNQAKQQAGQLEQLAKSIKSPLANRVAAAEKLLNDAAAKQAEAAQGEQGTAQAQQQAGQRLQEAAKADQQAAELDQQASQVAGQAEAHQQQAEAARQSAAAAEARADQGSAQGERQREQREKQQAAQDEQRAKALDQQSTQAEQRAAAAVKQADAAEQKAAAARRQAGEKQAQAQEALARAEGTLRGLDRLVADAAAKGPAQRSSASPDATAGEAQPASDAQANADSQKQALQHAAQGAQEAAQAQQQAVNNANDPGNALEASQEAAAALQQAAEAMAAATAASSPAASTDSVATTPEQQTPSQSLGKGGQVRQGQGLALDSKHGIGVSAGGTDERPVSVRQLGISAGDWARLGPLTQQELLNAAQQNGPPAYREMIKNYYIRIAQLDRDRNRAAAPAPREPRNAKTK
jgi:hypothetical protein